LKYILLIRHPESTKNIFDKIGTLGSFQLSHKGIEQAYKVSHIIAKYYSDYLNNVLFVSSPEVRCYDACKLISSTLNKSCIQLKLEPINSGILNGLTKDEAKNKYPAIMEKEALYFDSKLDGYTLSYPEGESIKDFQFRIINEMKYIFHNNEYTHFILILHQSVITAIINYFKHVQSQFPIYPFNRIDLCSFSEIVYQENKLTVNYINKHFV